MSTKFSEYLKEQQLDTRRLMAASHKLEQRKAEDRRPKAKKGADAPAAGAAAEEGEKVAKRRSGRPITPRLLTKALGGKTISGPAKTRLVRAVNYLLAQKKKDPVDMRALF